MVREVYFQSLSLTPDSYRKIALKFDICREKEKQTDEHQNVLSNDYLKKCFQNVNKLSTSCFIL